MNYLLDELNSQVFAIHKGKYPKNFIKKFGLFGFYDNFIKYGEEGLLRSIEKIKESSKVCGTTGFCVWCQNAFLWYIFCALKYNNFEPEKTKFLKNLSVRASKGRILVGTGLSNPMKAFAGFENHKLKALKTKGGYFLNGTLPWVSNISYNHYFVLIAKQEGKDEFIMGIAKCDKDKLTLRQDTHFIALEGCATKSVHFKDYFLEEKYILSIDLKNFLPKFLPGFVALQVGIALGLIENAILRISKNKNTQNIFITSDLPHFIAQKQHLEKGVKTLLKNPITNDKNVFKEVLKLKLELGKLCLELAQLAMLCEGSRGYLQKSLVHKLLLESYFVAIVTPSLRHIEKLLNE